MTAGPEFELGITYRGLKVRAGFDSASIADTIKAQFAAYGAKLGAPDEDAPRVLVLRVSALEPAPGWEHVPIHGGGDAVVPDGATLVTGPPFSITSVSKPNITVLRCDDDAHLPFVHHMVKYPIRDAIEARGGVLAHSAAVTVEPGSCALFLGRSGAGKTTVFVELVTRGFGGLGNDSTLLERVDGVVHAAAWPHIVRIGEGTAVHNSVLGRSTDWAPRSKKDGKYELFFNTLDEIFGRRVVGESGPVSVVVYLEIDINDKGFDCHPLSTSAARELIGRQLVTERLPTGWLPGWRWEPDYASVRTTAELLLAAVPMYRLRVGVADPDWAERLADWLRAET